LTETYEMKEEKLLLRHGELLLDFSKSQKIDNPRSLQLAVDISMGKLKIGEDKDEEGNY